MRLILWSGTRAIALGRKNYLFPAPLQITTFHADADPGFRA